MIAVIWITSYLLVGYVCGRYIARRAYIAAGPYDNGETDAQMAMGVSIMFGFLTPIAWLFWLIVKGSMRSSIPEYDQKVRMDELKYHEERIRKERAEIDRRHREMGISPVQWDNQ